MRSIGSGSWLTSSPVTPRTTAQPIRTSPMAMARLATASLRSIRIRPRRAMGGDFTASACR
jgi:hypothetical protein